MPYAQLDDRGLLKVSGEEAVAFLQGLVSNDVRPLAQNRAVYAAMLTPQGRFLHDFFLLPWPDGILIDVSSARLPDLLQRLTLYRLRSKINLEPMPGMSVTAAWERDSGFGIQDSGVFSDPRLPELGWRIIGEAVDLGPGRADAEAYERHRLDLGVPDGSRDMIADKSLLLEFGFEDLHGVDFAKGCYVGQEVTARSKHRGQVRRFIYHVRAGGDMLPLPGTPVMLGDVQAGEMRSSLGNTGLALLKVAEAEKAEAGRLMFHAGTAALKASLPQWVTRPPAAVTIDAV
ncbi:MAG: folate-binding protein YgfZ [Pseudomonadota bacterium]|nr:folate-binding protein YgfZ [Pseudomonadota bacterium]